MYTERREGEKKQVNFEQQSEKIEAKKKREDGMVVMSSLVFVILPSIVRG